MGEVGVETNKHGETNNKDIWGKGVRMGGGQDLIQIVMFLLEMETNFRFNMDLQNDTELFWEGAEGGCKCKGKKEKLRLGDLAEDM